MNSGIPSPRARLFFYLRDSGRTGGAQQQQPHRRVDLLGEPRWCVSPKRAALPVSC